MIESIYQIDFVDTATGGATRLLSVGDLVAADLDFPVAQKATEYDSLNTDWGGAMAMGGARRQMSWSRLQEHGSLPAAAGYCVRHPAALPLRREGKLRLTISGGEVWEMHDAVISSAATRLDGAGLFATLSNYSASAGRSVPVSGVAWYTGILTGWIMESHSSITRTHSS